MPIIRGRHAFDGHFTQIPNHFIRDKRLSYKARGLLAELMSHEPGFEVSREKLARNGQDGDGAIRSAIRELEVNGYLKRSQSRSEGQKFAAAVWVTQDPFPPSVSFPPAAFPPAEDSAPKNTKDKKTKERTLVQDELGRKFEDFWQVYPRKEKRAKALAAFLRWAEEVDPQRIIDGAIRYANDPNRVKQFTRIPESWLNGNCWEDDPLPERMVTAEEKAEKERLDRIRRDEARRAADKAERDRLAAEAERARANPPKLCEHDRIAAICPVCSRS